jgi:hypothetical protein
MKKFQQCLQTMRLDLGVLGERDVEVCFDYYPGTPDVMYLSNGDPGYPGDPDEANITSVTLYLEGGTKYNMLPLIDDTEELELKCLEQMADCSE